MRKAVGSQGHKGSGKAARCASRGRQVDRNAPQKKPSHRRPIQTNDARGIAGPGSESTGIWRTNSRVALRVRLRPSPRSRGVPSKIEMLHRVQGPVSRWPCQRCQAHVRAICPAWGCAADKGTRRRTFRMKSFAKHAARPVGRCALVCPLLHLFQAMPETRRKPMPLAMRCLGRLAARKHAAPEVAASRVA